MIDATLSLVAIFVPVAFLGGIVGRYFREFAVVLSSAIGLRWLATNSSHRHHSRPLLLSTTRPNTRSRRMALHKARSK